MTKTRLFAIIIELVGISVTGYGIGMISFKPDYAPVVDHASLIIAGGSLVFATGGMIYAKFIHKGVKK